MDDIKSKFSSVLSRATNTANKLGGKNFAGQGQRLGTAEERGITTKNNARKSTQHTSAASSSNNTDARSLSAPLPTQSSASTQSAEPQQQSSIAQHRVFSAQVLKPTSSHAALELDRIGTASPAVGSSTAAQSASSVPAQPASTAPALVQGSNRLQPAQLQQQATVSADQMDEMQHCLALIASQPAVAASSMEVLSKILSNLAAAYQEVKYRQLRLNNPRIKTLIVKVSGALEFLAAVGFQIHAADPGAAAGSDDDGFAVFIDDHQLGLVHEGLRQLQGAFPAAQSAQDQYLQQSAPVVSASALKQMPAVTHTPTPAAQLPDGVEINALARVAASSTPLTIVPAAPRRIPRDTLVLLPAAPDTTVPDWFFERTGAELKADYMAMLKVRQAGQVIASKAWQEAQSGRQSGPKPTVAVVRVRFPEGVCLQGNFHVSEPITAISEWVTESLRDPAITFQLIRPDRKPLATTGLVGAADLAPAVLLNFRPLSDGQIFYPGSTRHHSFLPDSLLVRAQAD